jgi:hypothetical protein
MLCNDAIDFGNDLSILRQIKTTKMKGTMNLHPWMGKTTIHTESMRGINNKKLADEIFCCKDKRDSWGTSYEETRVRNATPFFIGKGVNRSQNLLGQRLAVVSDF